MAYTPPSGNDADFVLSVFVPPTGNVVNFELQDAVAGYYPMLIMMQMAAGLI